MPTGDILRVTKLTPEQIGVLCWANTKWRPEGKAAQVAWLDDCIAVAMAESGGDINAISKTNDYGLFQINQRAHSALFGRYEWNVPADNVEMARQVYAAAGNKWSPWAAYGGSNWLMNKGHGQRVWDKVNQVDLLTGESGQSFVEKTLGAIAGLVIKPTAQIATTALGVGDAIGDAAGAVKDGVSGGLNAIQGAFTDAFKWLARAGITIGAFLLVVIMLILGIYLLVGRQAIAKVSPVAALAGGK